PRCSSRSSPRPSKQNRRRCESRRRSWFGGLAAGREVPAGARSWLTADHVCREVSGRRGRLVDDLPARSRVTRGCERCTAALRRCGDVDVVVDVVPAAAPEGGLAGRALHLHRVRRRGVRRRLHGCAHGAGRARGTGRTLDALDALDALGTLITNGTLVAGSAL